MIGLVRRGVESAFLGLVSLAPTRLMSHLLFVLRKRPDILDRWSYHVRPLHYYEPIPDFRKITAEQLARQRMSPAIDFRVDGQQALVVRLGASYGKEISELGRGSAPAGFDFANPYFSGLDAAAYYALIRDLKPALVMEIGSGFSTQLAGKALARNEETGQPGRLVCVEPYPEPRLTESGAKFDLVTERVQDLPPEVFDQLGANDILMIDSSHVATVGSDVCFELLDILPRLKPGVWVHIHDIFLPTDYPAEWVLRRRQAFNEQYMLEAFLAFNRSYSVQLANAWMWRQNRATASHLFDGSDTSLSPASFWIRREA